MALFFCKLKDFLLQQLAGAVAHHIQIINL